MKNKDPKTSAKAYATTSIVDAGARGAAGSISQNARITVELTEKKEMTGGSEQLREIAGKTLELLGSDQGVRIEAESQIPQGYGFGEKEAEAVACVLAVTGALARRNGSINEVKIDAYMKDQFYIVDDRLVNKKDLIEVCLDAGMALERIYASFYGGFAVADTTKREVQRNGEMETLYAVILTPEEPERMSLKEMMTFDSETSLIYDEALKGNLNTAMRMNCALYGRKTAGKMLEAGAIAVSGSRDGGFVAFVRDEDKIEKIADAVKDIGKTITANANNEKAQVEARPKRIYKVPEFLELRGEQKYDWL